MVRPKIRAIMFGVDQAPAALLENSTKQRESADFDLFSD